MWRHALIASIPVQRIAVGVEPALGALPVRADACDHAPERARVVHLDQVRDFVRRQVVEHMRRREDQSPRIGEYARRGARAPAAGLIADRDAFERDAEQDRIAPACAVEVASTLQPTPEVLSPQSKRFADY